MRLANGIPLVFVALLAGALPVTTLSDDVLYVQNGRSGSISMISIPGHEVIRTFPVGEHPDDVLGSSDGRILYVNLGKVTDHTWGLTESGEIVAVSGETGQILWRVPLPGSPHHLSLSSDDRYLYVPLFDRPYVAVIDTVARRVVRRIDGEWGMHGTRLSADGKRLYAGSIMTQTLYVLDVEKNKPVKLISFDAGVRPFAFTRDEKTLYAQLSGLHGFAVVDLQRSKVVRTVSLPGLPADFERPSKWPFNVNHGLDLSPDERYLLAAGSVIDTVAVYTHPDLRLIKTIPVGDNPNWIVFSRDGRFAYVSCPGSDEISVISMPHLLEVKRINTGGKGPARMRVVSTAASAE